MPRAHEGPAVFGYFARNVRKYRERRGLTQQQLAELLGVTLRRAQHLESGQARVSIAVLVRVAEALEVAPALLLRKNTAPPRGPGRPTKRPRKR